jgi:hypothetical protein
MRGEKVLEKGIGVLPEASVPVKAAIEPFMS